MNIIYKDDQITINGDSLILGADYNLKSQIKNNFAMVDRSFSYATKTLYESFQNYDLDKSKVTDRNISDLKLEEYYYWAIILKLKVSKDVLVIDEIMSYLRKDYKDEIINIARDRGIKLIIFSNELDDIYDDFEIVVYYKNKVAMKGSYKSIVKEDAILKRLGYEVPFYPDISNQLRLFGLISNVCYSKKELEEALWK